MGFVDKVIKGSEEFDIRDGRLPEASQEDAGKAIMVGESGEYGLGEAGGSIPWVKVEIPSSNLTPTIGDFVQAMNMGEEYYQIKLVELTYYYQTYQTVKNTVKFLCMYSWAGGGWNLSMYFLKPDSNGNVGIYVGYYNSHATTSDDTSLNYVFNGQHIHCYQAIRPIQDEKTYVLKSVNGLLQWVEEQQ